MTLPSHHTAKSTSSMLSYAKLYSSFRNKVSGKFRNFLRIFITRSPFRYTSPIGLSKSFEELTIKLLLNLFRVIVTQE